MSNADTNNIGLRLMVAGEFLNTWGDPNLNNDLIVLSNLSSKWNNITINGDYTVSDINYATNNPSEVATIKLVAGTVAAPFNFTLPNRAKSIMFWNATGFAATIKLSASTGFSLPTNRIVRVGTDGATDVYNMSPNYLGTTYSPNALGDAANVAFVQTAVATASLPATAGTLLNSGGDLVAGYHLSKHDLVLTGAITGSWDTETPGGNEKARLNLTVGTFGLVLQAEQTAGFTATAGKRWPVNISITGTIVMPTAPNAGDVVEFENYGTGVVTFNFGGTIKYYGNTASISTSVAGVQTFIYTNATQGWIDQ